ncbi:MAG: hypothetical protein KatS3mg057_0396 [Herpetosiphonaceae bacterium]|nr:MAG: hypothetical protein KatS3mg057_0396 [Herpetosiphonaceae bacterium]
MKPRAQEYLAAILLPGTQPWFIDAGLFLNYGIGVGADSGKISVRVLFQSASTSLGAK